MFSNVSEHLRNVIQLHLNSFFSQKITKNRPTAGEPPSVIHLSYTSFLNTFSKLAQVGKNNIISKAQHNKAQRSFPLVKAQRKMRNLICLISEAQRNFRNELFDSVEAQRNYGTAFSYQVKAQPNFRN